MPHRGDVASFWVLSLLVAGSVGHASALETQPIQITFEEAYDVEQATTAIGRGFDSILVDVEVLHAAWLVNRDIYYRTGRFGKLSRPRLITPGAEKVADPAVSASGTGRLSLVWAAELSPGVGIEPDEWNLLITHAATVSPGFLTEDVSSLPPIPDRHHSLVARRDSLWAVWERGTPSQIAFTLVSDAISVLDRRIVVITDNPFPSVRPIIADNRAGHLWVVWTSLPTPSDGDIRLAQITGRTNYRTPVAVRVGAADDRSPSLSVDSAGRPHIVWQDGEDRGPIHYVYGLLGGGFSPILTLTKPGAVGQNPQIVMMEDDVPRITWQDAQGGLSMAMIVGADGLDPVTHVSGVYNPRQRIEGVADVWPGMYRALSNLLVTAFIGPDRNSQMRNLWLTIQGEEHAVGAISQLLAEGRPGATPAPAFLTMDTRPAEESATMRATPNPFNGETALTIEISRSAEVRADIYSLDGRRVVSLADGRFPAGRHSVRWDGRGDGGRALGSGVYWARCRFVFDDGNVLHRTASVTLLR